MPSNIVFKKIHSEIKDEQTFNEKQRYVALRLDKKNTGPIQKIWGKVQALWAAVKNPDIPWYQKALPLAGLVYLVSPLDLVPDVIPGVGLLDDAAVIMVILKNIGHKIRQISDNVIEKKITDAQTAVTVKIDALYADYKRNVLVTIILNASVIAVTLTAYFFWTINTAVICISSIIPIIMMIRSVYLTAKAARTVALNINRPIQITRNDTVIAINLSYWQAIQVFVEKVVSLKSVQGAIKEMIRFLWQRLYKVITNDATRKLHSAGEKIRIIKSPVEIEESIVNKFYPLIRDYLLHTLLYKIAALFAFYGIFLLLLKQLVFEYTIHRGIGEVMLYPFTVALPMLLSIIENWMPK